MQVVCCSICYDWRGKDNKWFTPTVKERRDYHFVEHKKYSHVYCPHCFIIDLKSNGTSDEEIAQLVKELEA